MGCGVGASGMPRPTRDCTARRGALAPVRGWVALGAALVDGLRRPPRKGGGADHGPWPGIAPSADGALGRWGSFARCDGRPGRCTWTPRFGLHAARWQEWSARNFASGQGVASQAYWMYDKKTHRRHGGKGPASTADTRVVGSPHKKKTSKTFYFWTIGGFTAQKTGHAANHRGAPGGGDNKDY